MDLPATVLEALKLSPPGWSRESSAPPPLGSALPAGSELLSPDHVAAARYALIVADSLVDLDEENHAMHREGGEYFPNTEETFIEDPSLDWDGVLLDAMATLGLEPVGMPDWLWTHVRWSNAV
ncbi:hypothetical protein [Dactylosporangium sp. CA-233914]|uniref:hypothetical protein n=1 Tax=Dactylosporangium sp. CA-233914 TaxID=3239934 RepID=UPI003D8F5D6C